MAVMDEFKEEREALKHGTPKEKFAYFWDYYKWYVIGAVFIIAAAVSLARGIMGRKEEAFCAVILNSVELKPAAAYNQGFLEYAGIDPNTYDTVFDSSLYLNFGGIDTARIADAETVMAYVASGRLDVIIAGEKIFGHYVQDETFPDLRNILSQDQMEKYESCFYYADISVSGQASEDADPSKPELMDNPVPVGIYVDGCKGLSESYYNTLEDRAVLGIPLNTSHMETSLQYLDYLFLE